MTGVQTCALPILPHTDAKVFEVIVKLDNTDPILRPSMTTGNQIITKSFPEVIYIPLESVFATADSVPYVYTRDGRRQVVLLGDSNEDQIIIEEGLKPGEILHLLQPANPDSYRLSGEDLISVIKDRERQKREEAERQRRETQQTRQQNGNRMQLTPEQIERMMQMRGTREGGQQPGAAEIGRASCRERV